MTKKDIVHIKSGGRRIALYAELGRYFSPVGRLNESEFRAFLRESLEEKSRNGGEGRLDEASGWLSSYLEQVLEYLEDKGMGESTLRLFEVAVEESAAMGVDRVSISSGRISRILSLASAGAEAGPRPQEEENIRLGPCGLFRARLP